MLRSALTLAVGFLALIGFACVSMPFPEPKANIAVAPPPPPAMAAAPVAMFPSTAQFQTPACVAGQPFPASRIVDLANAPYFDPAAYSECGLRPGQNCSTLRPVPGGQSQYANMIAFAINNAASPALAKHLCSLNYIYVDTSIDPSDQNAGAWGMREIEVDQSGRRQTLGQHIGLRAITLSGLSAIPQGPPGPFARYESGVIRYLLNLPVPGAAPYQLQPDAQAWVNAVAYTVGTADPGSPNAATTAVLGLLAHEMGHVLWVSKVQSSDPNDHGLACTQPGLKTHFHSYSWPDAGHQFGFHRFGEIDDQHRPTTGRNIKAMLQYLRADEPDNARSALQTLYTSQNWASLFATVSVDEDFVETYMLHQLIMGQVPLTAFQLSIPPAASGEQPIPVDVMNGFTNSTSIVAQKARWIDSCL